MIIPVDPNATATYVHESELDKDGNPKPNATIVHLRMATPRQAMIIADRSARVRTDEDDDERALEMRMGLTQMLRLKFSIFKVENYQTDFETELDDYDPDSGRRLPTDAFLATFPDDFAVGCAARVTKMRECTVAEVGKSGGQSAPPSTETRAATAVAATN